MGDLDLVPESSRSRAKPLAVSTLSSTTRMRSSALSPRPRRIGRRLAAGLAAGQADRELAPLAGPFALGRDARRASRRALDERQADAEPALGAGDRASPWAKRSNISGSISGGMPIPLSRTVIDDLIASPLGREPDMPAALGVLGGVGEQVHEDLLEPRRVGVEPELALDGTR